MYNTHNAKVEIHGLLESEVEIKCLIWNQSLV